MPIDIDIAHVARLARLALSEEELELYREQLGVILDHAATVQGLDTSGVDSDRASARICQRFPGRRDRAVARPG